METADLTPEQQLSLLDVDLAATAVLGRRTAGTVFTLDEATRGAGPDRGGPGTVRRGIVEIVEGLAEDEEILQFALGVDGEDIVFGDEMTEER